MAKLTPAMQQYMKIKNEHKDCIVFFRIGDFYETFYDDAKTTSRELEITLTKRGIKNSEKSIPLAGVPYHSIDSYLPKLVKKGYKVAIVEQLEDASDAKGIVDRGVVRIVTPGTIVEENMLDKSNNFLMALTKEDEKFGLSLVDISTGEFLTTEVDSFNDVKNEITKYSPQEILIPSAFEEAGFSKKLQQSGKYINFYSDVNFYFDNAKKRIKDHFEVSGLDSFGISGKELSVSSGGALLNYIYETQKTSLSYINKLRYYSTNDYMVLDEATIKNLELIKNLNDNSKKQTLLSVLDRTVTSMGARLLLDYIRKPLIDINSIRERLNCVKELSENEFLRGDVVDILKEIYDLERIISRINYGNANPRHLISLKESLKKLPELKELIKDADSVLLKKLSDFDVLSELAELLERSIIDDPPVSLTEGNFIKPDFNKELKELKSITMNAKHFLKELETQERKKTGIKSLKIKFNKIFGYFIEVTKTNLDLVPENYVKKQTLVNSERFFTDELKKKEALILGSEEKMIALEQNLFREVIEEIIKYTKHIQDIADKISCLDVLCSFSENASKNNYCMPEINKNFDIKIRNGRHPVVEKTTRFVPNDININEENRTMIITGPNMAGKSVYMRQAALIVLMAQIGSFVPAESAEIGIVDRIFTRVGASDDVSRGQSTFMVEMTETAQILNNATEKSLIILDEIGRGTSTYDGVSIAWAVAEHINRIIRAKTLFATHYHILNDLETKLDGVKNYNIAVKEERGDVIFLRKIIEGGTDKSYGVHVASLAGLPDKVIERAKEIQFKLEKEDEISERIVVEKKTEKKDKKKIRKFTKIKQMKLDELI
ncbi:DNA mismatch repair protein MutS [Candidatus Woesearchaeota archaeon]|nr:DNA mismatch repair protein MutS [Candidatus Woesearchaeota archaeon]